MRSPSPSDSAPGRPPSPRSAAGGRRLPWPDPAKRGVEAAKWEALISHRLRQWREGADRGTAMMQKTAAARSGLAQDRLSRMETNARGVDVIELLALAAAYGRSAQDVAALFAVPTAAEWLSLSMRREEDPRFRERPSAWPTPLWPRARPAAGPEPA